YVAGDNDIVTTGTFKYAYNWSGTNATVNNVVFTGTTSGGNVGTAPYDIVLAGAPGNGWPNPSIGAFFHTPDGITGVYGSTILPSAAFVDGTDKILVTLNNLTSGHTYLVQLWTDDAYYDGGTVTITCGNAVTLDKNKTNQTGPGQFVTGTFVAGSTAPVLTLAGPASGGNDKSALVNAIQVRDVTVTTGAMPAGAKALSVNSNFKRATVYDVRGRRIGIVENGRVPRSGRAGIYLVKSAASAVKIVKQ
ncbi:MAG: hypothetical protein PHC61_06425, partial [Chitinivibrionales bacterium]|nr:hypothetical protein [Chitinivibrionales bacterium]